jgi:hypothetical protein
MDERQVPETATEDARVGGRPVGVAIIALLQVVHAVAVALAFEVPGGVTLPGEGALGPVSIAAPVVVLVGLAIAVGLWLLHEWAWTATMVWVGTSMAGALYAYFQGEPQYALMVASLAVAFYLNQRAVRATFQRPRVADRPTARATEPAP